MRSWVIASALRAGTRIGCSGMILCSAAAAQDCNNNGIHDVLELGPFPGALAGMQTDGVDARAFTAQADFSLADNSFTIEAWIYRDTVTGFDEFFFHHGQTSAHEGLHIGFRNTGQFAFAFWADDLNTVDTFLQHAGEWHHWACTFQEGTRERVVYLDGQPIASDIAAQNFVGDGQITIGGLSTQARLNGTIDEVRVWDHARSQNDIQNDMSQSFDLPLPAGLLAYWRADDEGGGAVLVDAAGTNDLSLVDGAAFLHYAADDNGNGYLDECEIAHNVDRDTWYPTIQAAIDDSQGSGTIEVLDGIHTGPGNWDINFRGWNLTVQSASGNPQDCVIDCNRSARGFIFQNREGPNAVVQGFTIKSALGGFGGGIFCDFDTSPSILNCVLVDCQADYGGGIYSVGSSSTYVKDCTFERCFATSEGGGAYVGNSATFERCSFEDCTAILRGGGMFAAGGAPRITECNFTGCFGSAGGGLYLQSAAGRVARCRIANCRATVGAGMVIGSSINGLHIMNTAFVDNYEVTAIYIADSRHVQFTNVIIATLQDVQQHTVRIEGSAQNTFQGCSLFRTNVHTSDSSTAVFNSTIWGGEIIVYSGTLDMSYCNVEGGFPGPGNINVDPMFVDPGRLDFRLLPGSPCIDAGSNALLPADEFDLDNDGDTQEPWPYDFDNLPRQHDDCGTVDTGDGPAPIVDMGAFEFQGHSPVNAVLTDATVSVGSLMSGGLAELENSDDTYLVTRSGFGRSLAELHKTEFLVTAVTTCELPTALELTIESRIDQPAGIAQIHMRNASTGEFEFVHSYALRDADETIVIDGIDPTRYVAQNGEIQARIKHIVFNPLFAFRFDSFFDLVRVQLN